MEFKTMTLLSKEEYEKYRLLIPIIDNWWWLRTPNSDHSSGVCIIDCDGKLYSDFCFYKDGGIRPVCTLNLEPSDSEFWHKPKTLIGAKIKYGKHQWTVLDALENDLLVLCDKNIWCRRFDLRFNIWETSELKQWLETEGLKFIAT